MCVRECLYICVCISFIFAFIVAFPLQTDLAGAENGFVFGVSLESQLCGQPVPQLLAQCFGAIEKSLKTAVRPLLATLSSRDTALRFFMR
jgi:hypothetical protein